MNTTASQAGKELGLHRKTELKTCPECGINFTAPVRVSLCLKCKAKQRNARNYLKNKHNQLGE